MAGVSSSFPVPKHSVGMPQPFLSCILSVLTILPGEAAAPRLPPQCWVSPKSHSHRSAPSSPSSPSPSSRERCGPHGVPAAPSAITRPGRTSGDWEHPLSPRQPLEAVPGPREQRVLPVGSIRLLRPCGHPRALPKLLGAEAHEAGAGAPWTPRPVGYEAQGGQGLAGWVAQLAQPPGTVPRLLRHWGQDSNFHLVAAPSPTLPIQAEPAAPSSTQ